MIKVLHLAVPDTAHMSGQAVSLNVSGGSLATISAENNGPTSGVVSTEGLAAKFRAILAPTDRVRIGALPDSLIVITDGVTDVSIYVGETGYNPVATTEAGEWPTTLTPTEIAAARRAAFTNGLAVGLSI